MCAKQLKSGTHDFSQVKRKPAFKTIRGKINANLLNVRQLPDKTSKVVNQLRRNQIVHIIETKDGWHKIVQNGDFAYVVENFVDTFTTVEFGRVTTRILNIRQSPNTESLILGKVMRDDVIKIIAKYQHWYLIDFNDIAAYITTEYIELTGKKEIFDNSTKVDSNQYFYQRNDLKGVQLAPYTKLSLPKTGKERTAVQTWNDFGNLIQLVSNELEIEVEAALAVLCVESGGKGYGTDGKMIIRFENHVFHMLWGEKNQETFDKFFHFDSSSRRNGHKFRAKETDDWDDCHTNQDEEWKILQFARKLANAEALSSISMGAPQVMGFNYKIIGYQNVEEMFNNFNDDIRYHLFALFDFCKYRPQRIEYLKKRDFLSFSKEYNGTAAPEQYEKRILEFYDVFKKILS